MLTPFALFFGLTVATAVIAYWSDNLGKKLGKKRISLYGMRPRTTATVLTIASSWGIMLFTLIVMLVVAKPLRDALFRFDSVNKQRETLAAQRDQLIQQKAEIEKSLGDQQKRLERVEKQAGLAGVNARKAESAAKESQRQQDLAVKREAIARRSEKSAINSERSAKRGAVAAAKRAEDARQGEIAAKAQARLASANLGQVQSQLQQSKERLEQTNLRLLRTNNSLESANLKLLIAQSSYENAQKKLHDAQNSLRNVKEAAKISGEAATAAFKEAAIAKKEAENAREEYESARQQVSSLNQQRVVLQQDIANLKETVGALNVLATRPVLITYNQTIAARTLPRGLAPARIESHLRSLFKVAQETGERLMDSERVKVILVQSLESSDGNDPTKIPDDQVYSSAADYIAASNREVSVRIVSLSNFAQDEPFIYVRFQMVEVKKAVNAGEVLALRTIDSKSGDSSIFASLLDLVEVGRAEATRRGINPPQSADDPNFYENGTNEQIFEALRKIEKIGGTPTVSIVATDDLSTVEPIRVRFEVS